MPIDVSSVLSDQDEMTCRLGLMVYSGAEGVLATIHRCEVPDGGGAPVLMPGECLEHSQLQRLSDRLSERTEVGSRRLLPPEVLVSDSDLVAWHRPAQRRIVFFETGTREFDAATNGKMALYPPLLFLAQPRQLVVYALGSDDRPGSGSPVYRAPFLNIYGGGKMCAGTAALPSAVHPDSACIAEFEKAFFASSFAHTALGEREISRFPGGHNALWKMLVATGHTHFPFWALVPAGIGDTPATLAEVLAWKR